MAFSIKKQKKLDSKMYLQNIIGDEPLFTKKNFEFKRRV